MATGEFDVLIIGGGPTGLVLANLLGTSGLSIAVFEKQEEVYPIPRATHLDEETLRNFRLTGLMDELEKHITPFGTMEIVNAKGQLLFEETIIEPGVEHGYTGSCFFDQPAFERILREGLKRFPNVHFLTGKDAIAIEQSENGVSITVQDVITKEKTEFNGTWAVGCDGGRSMVREALAIEMDAMEPARDWVIVDTLLKDPADAVLLPNRFRYMLQPERLCIFAYGIGINNRWEFQLGLNETMPGEETVKAWVSKYIALDKITITRIAKYAHNSLVARAWRKNRIFLAGDAAHMMPPSAGQGLCSGVRDAVNLAWKLEAVIKGTLPVAILDTYEQERKPHLNEILKRTLFIGSRLQADNTLSRFRRDLELRIIQNVMPVKEFMRNRYGIPTKLKGGFLDSNSLLAGKHLPQHPLAAGNGLSDDLTGYRFSLITTPGTLSPVQIKTAEDKGVLVIANEEAFTTWLKKQHTDFVLVRPDKIIFGSGSKEDFTRISNELFYLLKPC